MSIKKIISRDAPTIFIFVLIASFFVTFMLEDPLMELRNIFATEDFFLFAILYFFIITISTIFSPITIAPAIPFVSKVFGSTETFWLTSGGIILGSMVTFYLARHKGEEFIFKIFPKKKFEEFGKEMPRNLNFWNVLFFRTFSAPDSLSYFLGVHSKIKGVQYFLATALGIIPFTFILSFGADAVSTDGRHLFFFLVFAILIIIFSKVFYKVVNMHKAKLVTHAHNFHIDDIFACATLALFLEKRGVSYKVIRTRDQDKIEKYQQQAREKKEEVKPVFVFDVGGIYDEENNLFDHHQREGAGERENGVQYSSFGLVWKKYGEKLCGSKKVAEVLDHQIVMGIDANDTGLTLEEHLYDFSLYSFPALKNSFTPISGKAEDFDEAFLEVVDIAKRVLKNEIDWAHKRLEDERTFEEIFSRSPDKRVIWIEESISVGKFFPQYPEILLLVKKKGDGTWVIITTLESNKSKTPRVYMPQNWGGLKGKELEEVSKIPGAKFCHRGLWIAAASNKEAAENMVVKILQGK